MNYVIAFLLLLSPASFCLDALTRIPRTIIHEIAQENLRSRFPEFETVAITPLEIRNKITLLSMLQEENILTYKSLAQRNLLPDVLTILKALFIKKEPLFHPSTDTVFCYFTIFGIFKNTINEEMRIVNNSLYELITELDERGYGSIEPTFFIKSNSCTHLHAKKEAPLRLH